jgi:tRNA/tmRNA/rRNA uracil-C5-methylase (TrmA/RlmC/RlmD family)
MKNIHLSIDSIFSITKPELTTKIAKLIKKYMQDVDYVIDGTSNIGSTAIVLSDYFKYIYAVEINKITYNNFFHVNFSMIFNAAQFIISKFPA